METTAMTAPMDPMAIAAPPSPEPVPGTTVPTDTSIPEQHPLTSGGYGSGLGNIMFEDYFPRLDLSEEEEASLVAWFERDLRSCVKHVDSHRWKWGKYRAVYLLEYVEKFYPDMGIGADFASGLLCEKVLDGMNRMKKAVFSANPLFAPDTKMSGADIDISFLQRAQWALHTMLVDELEVQDIVGDVGTFEFLLDGSMILEADTMFEKVPQRSIKLYTNIDDLTADRDKIIDDGHFDAAVQDLQQRGMARVLIEENVMTKNGLQLFHVDKGDHLVPEGVYSDRGIRFRARRMYLTTSDLRLMADDQVNWYDSDTVEEVIKGRGEMRNLRGMANDPKSGHQAREMLKSFTENYDLSYQWQEEDDELRTHGGSQPYQDVFSVYRITCKYGYKTTSDPKGMIPKYCLFDYSPEKKKILRAVTYPHFKEQPNWFHFKFGYAPKSYYGFGFGARIMNDDFLESNAVDLFMDSSALATFNPFLCKHPDAGGRVPFTSGYGPAKMGYVNDPVNDFKQLQIAPPSEGLLRMILPLTQTRVANRTSVTPLSQGRTESSDPRSPAQKTAMLLGQSGVGLDVMVDDWNRTGWNPTAKFVWNAMYEAAVYVLAEGGELKDVMGGLIVKDATELAAEVENKVTVEELRKALVWRSLASSDYLNPQARQQRFMQMSNIFLPMLSQLAQMNPEVYKVYFLRWMKRAAQELDLSGASFLIPTLKELSGMPVENMQGVMQNIMNNMRANASQTGNMTSANPGE